MITLWTVKSVEDVCTCHVFWWWNHQCRCYEQCREGCEQCREGFLGTALLSVWVPVGRQGRTILSYPCYQLSSGAKTFCWGLLTNLRVPNSKPYLEPEMITSSTLQTKLADITSVLPLFSFLDYAQVRHYGIWPSSEFRKLVYWMLGLNSKISKFIWNDFK